MDRNDELFERAQEIIPGGVNSPVRAFRSVGGSPRFIDRAKGPYMWDVTGKRFRSIFRQEKRSWSIQKRKQSSNKGADQ